MEKKKTIVKRSVILVVIAALCVGVAVILHKQRNNIIALNYAVNYSAEDREKLREDNDKLIVGIVDSLSSEGVDLLTDEEKTQLKNGELSKEQVFEIIGEASQSTAKADDAKVETEVKTEVDAESESKTEVKSETKTDTADDKSDGQTSSTENNIAALIAQIYSLRSTFSEKVDQVVSQALSDLASGEYTKSELISKYLEIVSSLEASCDEQFDSIVSQIESELKRTGGDFELISELRAAYQNEKNLKKASILSDYAGK